MFDPARLAAFMLAGIALNLTPGPDTFYVLARSLGQGRRAGVVSALGVFTGCLVHIAAAAWGLSALIMHSATAFNIVKTVGALYLIYLGVGMLRAKAAHDIAPDLAPAHFTAIYRQGIVTNVFNPKVALFFMAFLPQFVDPGRGHVTAQFLCLGLIFDTVGTGWLIFLASISGAFGGWLRRHPRFARTQQRVTGGVLVALGVRLAFTSNR